MIYVSSITLNKTRIVVQKDHEYILEATVLPENATNKNLKWTTTDSSIATVSNGVVTGKKAGSVYIEVDAMDGSFEGASCFVQVTNDVLVTKIDLDETVLNLSIDDGTTLLETVYPQNAANCRLHWSSSNYNVATVNPDSGFVTAQGAGIAVITARATDGSGVSAECEVWVKGKTPVFLIHGRISHSNATWGIKTGIPSGANNDFNSDVNAEFSDGKKYVDVNSQKIVELVPSNYNDEDKPCNLGFELKSKGYKENVNLFAFNYPNQDAVVHSAKKFKKYIENLINYVRTSGTNEMKACFYASKSDYDDNIYQFNIVAHSMGGLVARYYIENLHQDCRVDKLITICTPHWGSGYADLSNFSSIAHELCDHDLDFDSVMFGGNNEYTYAFDENGCKILIDNWKCVDYAYELSDELQYSTCRSTKYYAIAGIDHVGTVIKNDYHFSMPNNYTTYKQIADFLSDKKLYRYNPSECNPKGIGDNMVGFLSQIGWTENIGTKPNKKIQMEKIFVDADTDGGNGGGVLIVEILPDGSNIFHSKVNHREPVRDKVIEFLEE